MNMPSYPFPSSGPFSAFVAAKRREGRLIVQPRMGFGSIGKMREGLLAVKHANATTVGTITLDSYTRVNDTDSALRAIRCGSDLNGYPLVAYGAQTTRQLLSQVLAPDFPVQVRHGSALPEQIFVTLLDAGLDATEGGPISYCLPYSRVPLRQAIASWAVCCRLLGEQRERGLICHLESFGGCRQALGGVGGGGVSMICVGGDVDINRM